MHTIHDVKHTLDIGCGYPAVTVECHMEPINKTSENERIVKKVWNVVL